jgi:UDP-sugar pyrophosphorylase
LRWSLTRTRFWLFARHSPPTEDGRKTDDDEKTTMSDAVSTKITAHADAGVLNANEAKLMRSLVDLGQSHLFEAWPAVGVDDEKKRALAAQLMAADAGYPGGVAKYVENARGLLAASKEGKNPFEGWTPSVPTGKVVEYGSASHVILEKIGMEEAAQTCFVLVAGGLGERLGYSGIKVELPVERATDSCYLELYVKNILALQERNASRAQSGGSCGCFGGGGGGAAAGADKIPLAIMTSDDTHQKTLDLLERNDYFGADKDQITLMKQEKVPCLTDNDAHLALKDDDPYKLQLKPHGHGDVHSLLHTSGLLSKWMSQGKKWVVFFQDTNSLVFRVIPGALGVSKTMSLEFNSLCVPRKAKEAVGAISLLTHKDGRKMTINVEYNQLDPLLRATTNPEGDVNDSTGFSPFPGNINQLIVSLPEYAKQLKKTGGAIEEFVNPKYKDSTKTAFKSPTRLECMMQDYPKSLSTKSKVGFTVFANWIGYSPVKNSPADGLAKFKADGPTHTATSGEFEFYESCANMLRLAGADVPAAVADAEYNGMKLPNGPRVVLGPDVATTFTELKSKVGSIKLGAKSTLIVEGSGVNLKNVEVDGTLIIKACEGAKVTVDGLKVKNKGWTWKATGKGLGSMRVREVDALRGFIVKKDEEQEFIFDKPGQYSIP